MNNEIIERLERIETKLDNVIKSLHDYDEGTLHCEYSGLPSVEAYSDEAYGESSFEAFQLTNDYISSLGGPCVGHDKASWDEEEAERRMNIIGQNGNEGSHYVTNEEADDDAKINNIQPKQKQYYKNKRSKRSDNKKSAVVEHEKHPPHKH